MISSYLGSLALIAQPRVEPLPAGSSRAQTDGIYEHEDETEGPRLLALLYRRWLDDPQRELSGLSPRQAVTRPEHHATLERQLRSLEHGSAREHPDGEPGPEVRRLRGELALEPPLAA